MALLLNENRLRRGRAAAAGEAVGQSDCGGSGGGRKAAMPRMSFKSTVQWPTLVWGG